jgi:hypothetical protein
LSLTYPDGDVQTSNYGSGGSIQKITGPKESLTYPY